MGQMIDSIAALQDYNQYRDLHWEGSFEAYLEIVRERPEVTRNAFQRVYDMIIRYGTEEYTDNKKKLIAFLDDFLCPSVDNADRWAARRAPSPGS